MDNIEQITEEPNDSHGLGERVREHLPVGLVTLERRARAQWIAIPDQLRVAVDDLVARVRTKLDLPSRTEIADLVTRIEQLDRKLADLEAARAAKQPELKAKPKAKAKARPKAKATPKAKAKTAKKRPVASKSSRRDAIKKVAGRKKR
jgi:hypothetical protein